MQAGVYLYVFCQWQQRRLWICIVGGLSTQQVYYTIGGLSTQHMEVRLWWLSNCTSQGSYPRVNGLLVNIKALRSLRETWRLENKNKTKNTLTLYLVCLSTFICHASFFYFGGLLICIIANLFANVAARRKKKPHPVIQTNNPQKQSAQNNCTKQPKYTPPRHSPFCHQK